MTADQEPPGSPVTAVHGRSRGPSAGFAVVGVVAAVTAAIVIAVVSGPSPQPIPSASPVALVTASPSSPAPSGLPVPSSPPAPSPSPLSTPVATGTIVVLRGVTDPASELVTLTGCSEIVRIAGLPPHPRIKGADVDAVAQAAGRTTGWMFVPPGIQASSHVWLGTDLVEFAQAVGQQVVATSPAGEVWLGGPSGATRWFPIPTPKGLTAWVMGTETVVGRGTCSPWTLPAWIGGQRSLSCSGVGEPGCLQEFLEARSAVGDLVFGNGDAVVAEACTAATRPCPGPTTVVTAPARWSGSMSDLRAAERSASGAAFQPVDARVLEDPPLDALSRPALPLPTGGEKLGNNTCAETLAGQLHAAPWDPRVAWAGDMTVVWPTGTRARFLPRVWLNTLGSGSAEQAVLDDPVVVTGILDDTGLAFDACSWTLGSAGIGASGAMGDVPAVTPGPLAGRGTGG